MLDLFISKTCPYCKKVLTFLEKSKIKYKIHDVANSAELEELMTLGGKNQVPFLYDKENNIKMYESLDIIEYLKTLKV